MAATRLASRLADRAIGGGVARTGNPGHRDCPRSARAAIEATLSASGALEASNAVARAATMAARISATVSAAIACSSAGSEDASADFITASAAALRTAGSGLISVKSPNRRGNRPADTVVDLDLFDGRLRCCPGIGASHRIGEMKIGTGPCRQRTPRRPPCGSSIRHCRDDREWPARDRLPWRRDWRWLSPDRRSFRHREREYGMKDRHRRRGWRRPAESWRQMPPARREGEGNPWQVRSGSLE